MKWNELTEGWLLNALGGLEQEGIGFAILLRTVQNLKISDLLISGNFLLNNVKPWFLWVTKTLQIMKHDCNFLKHWLFTSDAVLTG